MDSHFLTEIEIEEFKCFKGFKTSGFKRVNLIGGKNNIGKTALLEAICINVRSTSINKMLSAIVATKYRREFLNMLDNVHLQQSFSDIKALDSTRKFHAKSNLTASRFEIMEADAVKEYHLKIDALEKVINVNEFGLSFERANNSRFIDSIGFGDELLSNAYEAIQTHDKEGDLNAFTKEFDSSIDAFKVIGDKPQCKTNGTYRDLTEFGDGLRSYISMICALYACENGYLFVDEIDNGIHYTQLDRLWEIILTLSKQTNCQVFASTHSKEMIESFARVAKKLDEQDVSYTLLVKNKQKELKTISLGYKGILEGIAQDIEVR